MNKLVNFGKITQSFLSLEKDTEIILRTLFVENRPYSDDLKRLLVIDAPDCLDNKESPVYDEAVQKAKLPWLKEKGYIQLKPLIKFPEHSDVKTYLMITFDNFYPNSTNPQFRDCTIGFNVLCHPDYWDLGNYRSRPIKILGIIDGILNESRLTGIGQLNFIGCNEIVLNENLAGFTALYQAIHWTDDYIPNKE